MDKAFKALDQRLRKTCSRRCVEPEGQDGVSCLLIAVIDQLHDLGLDVSDRDQQWLRASTMAWMIDNRSILVTDDWNELFSSVGELAMLCDFGPDFWDFLHDERAVGNHVVLFAICGFISQHFRVGFCAQACTPVISCARTRVQPARPWQMHSTLGQGYDKPVTLPRQWLREVGLEGQPLAWSCTWPTTLKSIGYPAGGSTLRSAAATLGSVGQRASLAVGT